jgi:hypothetical protein
LDGIRRWHFKLDQGLFNLFIVVVYFFVCLPIKPKENKSSQQIDLCLARLHLSSVSSVGRRATAVYTR